MQTFEPSAIGAARAHNFSDCRREELSPRQRSAKARQCGGRDGNRCPLAGRSRPLMPALTATVKHQIAEMERNVAITQY